MHRKLLNIFPVLSLDIGTKRVGIAYMQQLSGVADFKKILPREANKALNYILTFLEEKKIKTLLAGLPLNSLEQKTPQCADVEKFCRRIERRFKIETIFIDEYLSSNEAEQLGTKKAKYVDDSAAEIILKRFLASKGMIYT